MWVFHSCMLEPQNLSGVLLILRVYDKRKAGAGHPLGIAGRIRVIAAHIHSQVGIAGVLRGQQPGQRAGFPGGSVVRQSDNVPSRRRIGGQVQAGADLQGCVAVIVDADLVGELRADRGGRTSSSCRPRAGLPAGSDNKSTKECCRPAAA